MEFYLGGAPKYIMGISILNDTLDVQIQDVIPRIYTVKTIHEMSVKDFIEEYYKADMWDCPLEIELYNSQPDSAFEGWVELFLLGWLEIRNCTEENCFLVDTKGKLVAVESIVFGNLEITETNMKGMYVFSGPTIDALPIEFTATRK